MAEQQTPEDDRAELRLRTVMQFFPSGNPLMRRDFALLRAGPSIHTLAEAEDAIDEALSLVAHDREIAPGDVQWSLRQSTRAWMNGEAVIPGPDNNMIVSRSDFITWVIFNTDHGRFLPGMCSKLWDQMLREIA